MKKFSVFILIIMIICILCGCSSRISGLPVQNPDVDYSNPNPTVNTEVEEDNTEQSDSKENEQPGEDNKDSSLDLPLHTDGLTVEVPSSRIDSDRIVIGKSLKEMLEGFNISKIKQQKTYYESQYNLDTENSFWDIVTGEDEDYSTVDSVSLYPINIKEDNSITYLCIASNTADRYQSDLVVLCDINEMSVVSNWKFYEIYNQVGSIE